jgi:peptidoglycan hydrolase-like protein with peptidoglycan-binding domain
VVVAVQRRRVVDGARRAGRAVPAAGSGRPALAAGSKGDEVVWLQLHLASFDPTVLPTATFDAATDHALRDLHVSRGLPVTGSSDPSTWQALLSLPLQPVDWTVARQRSGTLAHAAP